MIPEEMRVAVGGNRACVQPETRSHLY